MSDQSVRVPRVSDKSVDRRAITAAESMYAIGDAAHVAENGARSTISDARLRRLLDANVVGIVTSNPSGAIIDANDAFLRMIGYTRAELAAGQINWRLLTPPEWLPLDEQAIDEMARRGSFGPFEKEYYRKDRTRVPISLGGARLSESDDQQICYIIDLSEIRQAEAALRRSESRYKRLSDANVIGIMVSRASDDVIIEANDEFLRIVGHSRTHVVEHAMRSSEMTPPSWEKASQRARSQLLGTGRFAPYEQEYYRADGSTVPVLVGGARLEGAQDEIISYILDLTEQRQATRRIAQSEQRYRILAEALPQIVMIADGARRPVYVNRHYVAYTGFGIEDMPGRWLDAIHPDDLPMVERARMTGENYELEYRLRRASDGAYRWHFARVLKFVDAEQHETWLGVALDIDDRKRAEDTLRFIERAGSVLTQSLDLQTTFETLLDLVIPDFGDWATISLCTDEGILRTVVARHRDPAKASLVRTLRGAAIYRESHAAGTPQVVRTGHAQVRTEVTAADVRAAINDEFIDIYTALGYRSLIALPIRSEGAVIGSFSIMSTTDPRRYTEADFPALNELARWASLAVENAQRFEREHRVADSLQQAALPRTLPTVAGYHFDAYYQAGRREAAIGGDWFDAVLMPAGQVVVSVGDVAGSGLESAVLMGNVRQVLRAAAHVHSDPAMMLDVADRTLRSERNSSMVTAFIGVIDPTRRLMTYASAGHVPALLRAPDRTIESLAVAGLPIGCRHLAPGENAVVALPPGSHLLLYTDGLVEWSRDYLVGDAILRDRFAAADLAADSSPAKALVERVLPASGPRDDVAVLLIAID